MKKLNLKVLIVEDDLLYAAKLKFILEKKVMHVELRNDLDKGLEYAKGKDNNIDVLFLDNLLPSGKGCDALELFKDIESNNPVTILISANYSVEDIATGIQNGSDFLIDKKDLTEGSIFTLLDGIIKSKKKDESLWRVLDFFKSSGNNIINNIAIVEDDELFCFHLNWILSDITNHTIINTFSTAKSFYKNCKNDKPDLVFLDYNLTDTKAEKIVEFLKNKLPKAKIVLLTGQTDTDVAINASKLGIDAYIVKNKNWRERVKEVVNKLGV